MPPTLTRTLRRNLTGISLQPTLLTRPASLRPPVPRLRTPAHFILRRTLIFKSNGNSNGGPSAGADEPPTPDGGIGPGISANINSSSSTNGGTDGGVVAEAYLEQPVPGISFLSLNRPRAKNAISMRMLKEFDECLDTVHFDKSTRVLIVRSSTPGSFCAGADLIERRSMSPTQVDKFLSDLRTALGKLETLPVPTIAAIGGPALGGGLELALACDLRVAAHSVMAIGLPEVKLGIIPGAGGTQRLTRLLGLSKAKDLIFTGRALNAREAFDYGVVDYVSLPETTAVDRALVLAKEIALNAPLSLKAAKQAISRAPELSLESGLDFERAAYEPLLHTQDRLEALQAFRERRQPIFKGE